MLPASQGERNWSTAERENLYSQYEESDLVAQWIFSTSGSVHLSGDFYSPVTRSTPTKAFSSCRPEVRTARPELLQVVSEPKFP